MTVVGNSYSTLDLLGVRISEVNLEIAAQVIDEWVQARLRKYVCIAPVATLIDCQDDPAYKAVINAAAMTTPDGMPVVWLGRYKGSKIIDRTYGPDLMTLLCQQSSAKGYKHFFYGGTPTTLEKLVDNLKTRFWGIQIVGTYAPGILALKEQEKSDVIELINRSGADILWVGLGSPKQDFWMALHREQIHVPVMIGAGAAFDFLAGAKPQAPRWLQRSGLEWVFRLCCEPRRLWRRYLIGNTRFVFLVIFKELFQKAAGKVSR